MSVTPFGILFPLGFGIFLGIANYAVDRSRYGARIARERIPGDVLAGVTWIVFLGLFRTPRNELQSFIWAVVFTTITILIWVTFLVLALRKPQTGKVLLRLGRLDKNLVWTALLFGACGVGILLLNLNRPQSPVVSADGLSFVVSVWSLGVLMAVVSRKESLVTEKGVQIGYTSFKWEDVKYTLWSDESDRDHYLFFKLKHRPVLLNTSTVKIPEEQRQAVSEIMGRYVAGDSDRVATELRA
jgi:hypothetical protein